MPIYYKVWDIRMMVNCVSYRNEGEVNT